MSEYNLVVGKNVRKVKLPSATVETIFEAEVDGKTIQIELVEDISFDKPFLVKVNSKPCRVELNSRKEDTLITVKVDGVPYPVKLEKKNQVNTHDLKLELLTATKQLVKTQISKKGVITASMPGKVAIVRVKAGSRVHVGDVLLVLEAMKMENEITSPINGVVKEVRVSEGAVANVGQILIIIDEN